MRDGYQLNGERQDRKFDIVISSGKSPFIAIILFLTGIKERIGYNSKTAFLLTDKVDLNENQYAGRMYHDLLKPLEIDNYSDPEIKPTEDSPIEDDYIAIHPGVSKMSLLKNIKKCPETNFWISLINHFL